MGYDCSLETEMKLELAEEELDNLQAECAVLREVLGIAQDLYDNRLGHRDDAPRWFAPQSFWRNLGDALARLNSTEVAKSRPR